MKKHLSTHLLKYLNNKVEMTSRVNWVYLWVEPASEDENSIVSIFDHTSICVEFDGGLKYVFSFNENGIHTLPADGSSPPSKEELLGVTSKMLSEIMNYAHQLRKTKYSEYKLIGRNCNDFSNDLSLWLCDVPIPDEYLLQDVTTVGMTVGLVAGGLMDKNLQRNERGHRKLVRSSDQSWFGDILGDNSLNNAQNEGESSCKPGGKRKDSEDTCHHHRSRSIGHDNKTIRRLEFFTSLQKQLMSSIGRRGGGSDASSSSSCNVKRNASCRHHKTSEKLRDKSDQKQTMPSSYSSASLACCNNRTTSPVEKYPTTCLSSTGKINKIDLKSDQKSNNSVTIGNHLSPTASIASAIINDQSAQPIIINSKIKTIGSPISDNHLLFSSITNETIPITTISNQQIIKNDPSLSKSMPNTLMLSPTNPFFSSIEQHLIDQNTQPLLESTTANSSIDEKSSVTTTNNCNSSTDEDQKLPCGNKNYTKNPFLYEFNNGTNNTIISESFDKNSTNTPTNNNNNDGNNSSVSNNNDSKNKCNFQIGYVFPTGPCTKREEFLRATMKICLVVSPPSNKFQLKSRSLTHLDQLEPQIRTEDDTISSSSNKRGKQKISSSEYFSVCFDTENGFGEKDEIFIPATKGVYLSDSLLPALSHRSLSFSQISIIDNGMHNQYELGIPTYLGPLTGNTDIGSLAGRNLIVTEKDNSKRTGHSSLQKAASVGFRTKQSRFFSSASTEEAIIDNDGSKVTKQQTRQAKWSLQLFGVKNPQQSQLCELLNNYTKNGVPQSKTSSCSNFNNPEYLEALDGLENLPSSWTDIVTSTGMTETETKIQSAIWELVTTEIDYIHALKTVTDLFLACLEAIQMENILTEVDQNKLFSNIRDICEANLKFWSMYLYPMVKNCILTGYAMCIDYFQQGFSTFSSIFAPYAKYCAEQSTCQYYCKELNQNNALFTAYLAWCESQKMCNRLRLADILVRPMQRLTKYSLLLTAIRKHIADENDGEIMDSMIHSVEDFVCSVNAHLTTRQENERLKGIMARIEAYDVVDTNNEHLEKMVKQFSSMIDLCGPMRDCPVAHGRHLFMEGDLKFKDHLSKIDVHCFLLTDMLLICKTTAKKGHGTLKVVRQPYQTDRLQIKLKDNTIYCCYLNDYSLVIAAFTLQCSEAKNWHDSITKAKHIYTRLKQGSPWDPNYTGSTANTLQVRKSPLNSSIGSRVSSLNNSHSGSIELTESRNVSVDFEKTNSVSSDEGSSFGIAKNKIITTTSNCGSATTATSRKLKQTSSNSLTIQPYTSLGQSMPNLNVHSTHTRNNNENEYDKTNRNTITLGFGATTSTSSHEKCAELIKLEFCLPTYYKINLHR
uniref:CSON009190 protein n=1 Tax=Culicoides sonorensis TaxID=179676 RepID=A0A336MBR1_CULSO